MPKLSMTDCDQLSGTAKVIFARGHRRPNPSGASGIPNPRSSAITRQLRRALGELHDLVRKGALLLVGLRWWTIIASEHGLQVLPQNLSTLERGAERPPLFHRFDSPERPIGSRSTLL